MILHRSGDKDKMYFNRNGHSRLTTIEDGVNTAAQGLREYTKRVKKC